jgi:hypothetical protein
MATAPPAQPEKSLIQLMKSNANNRMPGHPAAALALTREEDCKIDL